MSPRRLVAVAAAALFALLLSSADAAQARTGKDQIVLSGSVNVPPDATVGTVVSVAAGGSCA